MPDWFADLAAVEDPRVNHLQMFVKEVEGFLGFVLEEREFGFLWEDEPNLRQSAIDTFRYDVLEGAAALRNAIPGIGIERLRAHGLLGRAQRFKLGVIASIARKWNAVKGKLTVRGWLKQIFEAIDVVLDSLIQ